MKQIITQGPSPWSAEFYLGSQNAPALEQSGVKGTKPKNVGDAHTKKRQEDMDFLSNFLAELYPNGYDANEKKQMTYKDILEIVKNMPGVRKWSEKDQAALAAQAARTMIRGTSTTSREEQLNKIKSVPYGVPTQRSINPVKLTK